MKEFQVFSLFSSRKYLLDNLFPWIIPEAFLHQQKDYFS